MTAEEFANMVFDKIDINGDGELWMVQVQRKLWLNLRWYHAAHFSVSFTRWTLLWGVHGGGPEWWNTAEDANRKFGPDTHCPEDWRGDKRQQQGLIALLWVQDKWQVISSSEDLDRYGELSWWLASSQAVMNWQIQNQFVLLLDWTQDFLISVQLSAIIIASVCTLLRAFEP